MDSGVVCAMMDGVILMLLWCVEDQDMAQQEQQDVVVYLGMQQQDTGWITLPVKELNTIWESVHIVDMVLQVIVALQKLLQWCAAVVRDVSQGEPGQDYNPRQKV